MSDIDPAPKAPKAADVRASSAAAEPTPQSGPPTIRDHAEAKKLGAWQVAAIVARLHGGLHPETGDRLHPAGVTPNTRMSEADFDAAATLALTGRI